MEPERPESRFSPWSWIVLLIICAAIVGWGFLQYAFVPDAPRKPDFGVLPDAPSQSIYSTAEPAAGREAPPQIAPLPGTQPPPKKSEGAPK